MASGNPGAVQTGLEGYIFDRIARGTVHVQAVNISLFGTAQPQRIANIITDAVKKHDDGLVQRLQLLAWPDLPADWSPVDRVPNDAARDAALACCLRLAVLDPMAIGAEQQGAGGIPFLRLAPAALLAFQNYRAELEAKVRSRSLSEPLAAHLSKYRGLIPRLALVLHLAGGGTGRISETAMETAIKWGDYLEGHARRLYGSGISADAATLVLKRIHKQDLASSFTRRDIVQKGWSGLKDGEEVGRALDLLVDHHWLRSKSIKTAGRSTTVYRVNPMASPLLAAG